MTTLLAIDAGTTSTRALAFDLTGTIIGESQREFTQIYPQPGWVEHDAEEIWLETQHCIRAVLTSLGQQPVAIGLTNQRETVVIWERATGRPIANAIVWQDRRTASQCRNLAEAGHGVEVTAKTGLVLDPYFSATKIAWILDNTPGARAKADAGGLAFGTIDSWLLWRLTAGGVHATDATNAARTSLYNIREGRWDAALCKIFNVPIEMLPEVRDSAGDFGRTDKAAIGTELPILGIAGDQQAATVGQACFAPGDVKSTYGTGCFALVNTGKTLQASQNRLLGTIAYRINGETTYALEGSIFAAGATIQWLRDGLKVVRSALEAEAMTRSLASNQGVYMVPAFAGLGAPWWDAEARGTIFGLTRDTGPEQLARAALEAIGYQTADLLDAIGADGAKVTALRVDGGVTRNDWAMQFLSDILAIPVERPKVTETTAWGAAMLAGLAAGAFESLEDAGQRWRADHRFEPKMDEADRIRLLAGWRDALERTLTDAAARKPD
jgi:glycerol kinase